jgi:hypothetical protein
MNKPMVRIVELDGTIIDREMNDEEFAQYQIDVANGEAKAQAEAEAAAKKAAAEAKLAALGLTADDLKALGLGGN